MTSSGILNPGLLEVGHYSFTHGQSPQSRSLALAVFTLAVKAYAGHSMTTLNQPDRNESIRMQRSHVNSQTASCS